MTAPSAANAIFTGASGAAELRAAAAILRGVQRLMRQSGCESLAELQLGNGRRADVAAIGPGGEIHIIEIKSSIADFNADQKWPEYLDYCDRFSFAVAPGFLVEILPEEQGLILADGYGGGVVRRSALTPLSAARRKALTLSFARTSAMRLHALHDPAAGLEDRVTPD
ncbi:MAG: MmcB family DNA repair protein [Hyphomicrobium sp.]